MIVFSPISRPQAEKNEKLMLWISENTKKSVKSAAMDFRNQRKKQKTGRNGFRKL